MTIQEEIDLLKAKNLPSLPPPKSHGVILYWFSEKYSKNLEVFPAFHAGTTEFHCLVTTNRKYMNSATAIVFPYDQLKFGEPVDMLAQYWKQQAADNRKAYQRNESQVIVWWSDEAPGTVRPYRLQHAASLQSRVFNWTMTYRRDADVYCPFGTRHAILCKVSTGKVAVDKIIQNKEKLAIWFVSNCGETYAAQYRMAYFKALLKAGLHIKMLGKCAKKSNETLPRYEEARMRRTIRRYKFYLAFENGWHCPDYVTEKLWDHALANDAVPIVWGPTRADVYELAPRNSYIHADDFTNPTALAQHVKYLDSNASAYREFFAWRETRSYASGGSLMDRDDALCRALHEQRPRKTIDVLYNHVVANNPPECIFPSDKLSIPGY